MRRPLAIRRLRSRRYRERGFAFPFVIVSIVLTVAASSIVATTLSSAYGTMTKNTAIAAAFGRSEQLEQRLSAEAAGAKAIFTPATAIDGAANCTGGQCRELDLYASGATAAGNKGNFIAYLATATGSVQRYVYTSTTGGVAGGVSADGSPVPGTSFFVREVPVTSLTVDPDVTPTTKAQLLATGVTPHRWTYQFEHQGVVASNDVFYVHYNAGVAPATGPKNGPGWGATATGIDVFALSVLSKPLSGSQFIASSFAPVTPPITSVGPSALYFPFPGSANQSLQVHETNYHDAFSTLGLCQMVGATIANTTSNSVFPSPNTPDVDSGPATFTFVPVQPGICSQIVKDVYGTTASLSVQVAGPLVVTPTTLTMSLHSSPPNGYPVNTATVQGTKTWSYTPLSLSVSNCPIVSAAQTQTDAPTFSAVPAGGIVSFTATATGSCNATVSDQFGETVTVNIVVYDDPTYVLSASPTSGTLSRGASMGIQATATLAGLPPGHSYWPPTANTISVGIVAQSYTGTAGGCGTNPGGWNASGTTFTVTDNDPVGGICSITFGADTTSANNPYATVAPANVVAMITFTAQAVNTYAVCNVVGNANYYSGSYAVDYSTNPPTQAVGSNLTPPCANNPPTDVLVCTTVGDPNYQGALAGTYDSSTNTQYIGSTAIPPCAGLTQVTVCGVNGDQLYDPLAGTTVGSTQYVGTAAEPPCAGPYTWQINHGAHPNFPVGWITHAEVDLYYSGTPVGALNGQVCYATYTDPGGAVVYPSKPFTVNVAVDAAALTAAGVPTYIYNAAHADCN